MLHAGAILHLEPHVNELNNSVCFLGSANLILVYLVGMVLMIEMQRAAEAAAVQVAAATPPPPMAPMTEYEKYMAKRNAGAAPVVSAGAAAPEPPAAAPMSEYEKYMAKRRAQGQ